MARTPPEADQARRKIRELRRALPLILLVGLFVSPTHAGVPLPEPGADDQRQERAERQSRVLRDYLGRWAQKDAFVAAAEGGHGKPFEEFSDRDYARFVDNLDLSRADDLWRWSHATGIPIIGVSRKSIFFYCNAHLLEDVQAATAMPYEELVKLQRGYDEQTGEPTLHTARGRSIRLRDLPPETLRRTARTGTFLHDEHYVEPRTLLEVLEPYLVPLEEIPSPRAIARGLLALPLSVVKVFRGKAIYLTTRPGRSYAVGMPVSNSLYKGFAGMQAGVFVDHMTGESATHNLVHEIGHVVDKTVIVGRYGKYLHAYQFPAWRDWKEEKDRVFGEGDSAVSQTDHGYVSEYARRNAQESFAEHFAFYILERESFRAQAEREDRAGHPELMAKYRLLEQLVERTPATMRRLSRTYLEELEELEE